MAEQMKFHAVKVDCYLGEDVIATLEAFDDVSYTVKIDNQIMSSDELRQIDDKPDYLKRMIDQWFPNKRKLEMFCRNHTPLLPNEGRDVWGNEVNSNIELRTKDGD